MRETCIKMVYELAKLDERIVFIGSDLSPGMLKEMRADYPDRFYMEGVYEQNIIGMAAGLAMDGYIPFVNTIATFITRRCYEQIVIDVCMHKLPIRLIGNGGGVVYAPLGPTHLAIEDMSLMRALPNMTIVSVCDANEMVRFMKDTLTWPHPIYIRLGKGYDPVVSRDDVPFKIGKVILMRESKGLGKMNILLLATGVMTQRALKLAEALEELSVNVTVLHSHTVKPLDEEAILHHTKASQLVVTLEENTLIGGFGSAVTDFLVETLGTEMPLLKRFALPDAFPEKYGSQELILDHYGLSPEKLFNEISAILQTHFAAYLRDRGEKSVA